MKKRGVHYWQPGMGAAQCGKSVNVGRMQCSGQIENVTCGLCLRSLKAENDRGPPLQHWMRRAPLSPAHVMCGRLASSVAVADDFQNVTCAQCQRMVRMSKL